MRNARLPLSFESLFVAQLLLLFAPTLVSAEWVESISRSFYTLLMLASLYMVSTSRRDLVIGIVLFVPVFTTRWMSVPFLAFEMQYLAYCIFQIVFLIYVMRKVYGFLLAAKKVDTEIIYASIILYVIFGLCLSLVYYGTLIISPGSLGENLVLDFNDPASLAVTMHDLIYFSFVTQTTLGYGDISPVTGFTRALASGQALVGQLYVAVIIARLVGVQIATTLKE
jgi:hypothetical protein